MTLGGKKCDLSKDEFGSELLIWKLVEGYKDVRKKFDQLIKSNYGFIGDILGSAEESIVSSVNRYTSTRKVSTKINAVFTSLMLKYVNILIHHLL
jgi:hypothetical protein